MHHRFSVVMHGLTVCVHIQEVYCTIDYEDHIPTLNTG